MKWIRSEWTTLGPDPTVVVRWQGDGISITEFQNDYSLELHEEIKLDPNRLMQIIGMLGEQLHIAKEELHESEEQVRQLQKEIASLFEEER